MRFKRTLIFISISLMLIGFAGIAVSPKISELFLLAVACDMAGLTIVAFLAVATIGRKKNGGLG